MKTYLSKINLTLDSIAYMKLNVKRNKVPLTLL